MAFKNSVWRYIILQSQNYSMKFSKFKFQHIPENLPGHSRAKLKTQFGLESSKHNIYSVPLSNPLFRMSSTTEQLLVILILQHN